MINNNFKSSFTKLPDTEEKEDKQTGLKVTALLGAIDRLIGDVKKTNERLDNIERLIREK